MQDIIAKYRKIMEKPVPPPFDGYMREMLEAMEATQRNIDSYNGKVSKAKRTPMPDGELPE
jgi:hypothetical protein